MSYKCYLCSKEFNNRNSYAGHISHHNRTKEHYLKNAKKMILTKKTRIYKKRIMSEENKLKHSKRMLEKNNPNYKNGIRKKLENLFISIINEYKECIICGSKKNLCIHHLNKNKEDNQKENLILLCRKCHDNLHQRGYNFRKEEWKIKVQEFFTSVQMEGSNHGLPSHFIRLSGCLMKCKWCDSKESWNEGNYYNYEEIINLFKKEFVIKFPAVTNLVITGGEVLEQNYYPLVLIAKILGWTVEIETNGTPLNTTNFSRRIHKEVDIFNISPKLHFNKLLLMQNNFKYFMKHNYIFKFVLDDEKNELVMENFIQQLKIPDEKIFIQPQFENKKSLDLCLKNIEKNWRRKLSVQVHKLIGVK